QQLLRRVLREQLERIEDRNTCAEERRQLPTEDHELRLLDLLGRDLDLREALAFLNFDDHEVARKQVISGANNARGVDTTAHCGATRIGCDVLVLRHRGVPFPTRCRRCGSLLGWS